MTEFTSFQHIKYPGLVSVPFSLTHYCRKTKVEGGKSRKPGLRKIPPGFQGSGNVGNSGLLQSQVPRAEGLGVRPPSRLTTREMRGWGVGARGFSRLFWARSQ